MRRARRIAAWLEEILPAGASVLDVGAGLGHLARALRDRGHRVVTVDPRWRLPATAAAEHLQASGDDLPVRDRTFDVVLLAFVLHHAPPDAHAAMLAEAVRVARRAVILLEDTYRTERERKLNAAVDSALNAELIGHPHSNRTAAAWCDQLAAVGLRGKVVWERWERWLAVVPIRHALLRGEVAG